MAFPWSKSTDWTFHQCDTGGQSFILILIPGGQLMCFHQQDHSQGSRLADQKEGWQLLTDLWLWDAQNCHVTLLWHSRCFRDQASLQRSLSCRNLMGLQEWKPLPKFWHSLWPCESEPDGCGLQEGILKQTRGWAQLQRPWGQVPPKRSLTEG